MIILENVYQEILRLCAGVDAESGGILGSENGIIKHYKFDKGLCSSIGTYIPNVNELNRQIDIWYENNIAFCGMFHSHFQTDPNLSAQDKQYINEIMLNMPKETKYLYFPLVLLAEKRIIAFRAEIVEGELNIKSNKIQIIKGGIFHEKQKRKKG